MNTSSKACRWVVLASVLIAGAVGVRADVQEKKPSAAVLKKYDKNSDGMLDADERSAWQAGVAAAKTSRDEVKKKYDANADGKLDTAEKAQQKADKEAAKALKAEKKKKKPAGTDGEKQSD